jgi:hypothetical protein
VVGQVAHLEAELRSKGGIVSRWDKVTNNGFLGQERSRTEMRREREREKERKSSRAADK